MSVPDVGVTKEVKETLEVNQVDDETSENCQKSPTENRSHTTPSKEPQKNKKDDSEVSLKRKAPLPSGTAKVAKTGTGQDVSLNSGTPSDLSTGSGREDNVKPKEETVSNTTVVMQHYNALEERGLSQRNKSRIVYLRNFNNWIKSMLIKEYLEKVQQDRSHGTALRVLDMCCGKGGDLMKWLKANINHLICVDIADVSIEQCQQRYNYLVEKNSNEKGFAPIFTAEFITADCTKVRLREKYKDASLQLDLVSCQFAFHYSFESLPQAECMLKNAGECLRAGGYFIGTIPDAYDLVSRWQKCDGNKFGNDIYNVEFLSDDKAKPPLFGAKYNFHLEGVVDCPEFLVHLPTLRKLALKFGLELVMFERFDSYYERIKGEGRSLLGKMQALETYPPFHEAPLLGQPSQDYQHAVQYMHNEPNHRKIGTLSQSEWEATSLYAVFAFQKMKTTWNSSGNPEYTKL